MLLLLPGDLMISLSKRMTGGGPDGAARHKAASRAKKQPRSDVVRALGKTVRLRNKDHRKFVLRQPCLGMRPCAIRRASPHLYATACTGPPSER